MAHQLLNMINIKVTSHTGSRPDTVTVRADGSVDDLVHTVVESGICPRQTPDSINIIFGNQILDRGRTLTECGLENDSTISVVIKTGETINIHVRKSDGTSKTVTVRADGTVNDLIREMVNADIVPAQRQSTTDVIFNREQLKKERTLKQCRLVDNSTVSFVLNLRLYIDCPQEGRMKQGLLIKEGCTVDDLIMEVIKEGILPQLDIEQVNLNYRETALELGHTLQHYGIESESTVWVAVRQQGGRK